MELQSHFPIKGVAGKCNPWLHFTSQYGLALGDRSGKISTPGCGPPVPPDLYSTQEDHASWFPLVPSDWGIWALPLETDQDSCPGWLPPVPLDLVSPQEGSSPGPLTPRFKCFPATRILPLPFVCSLCGTRHIALLQKHCQWEEFIKCQMCLSNLDTSTPTRT